MQEAYLHGDGDLVSALIGWAEEPPGGLSLLAQQGNGLWQGHILEAGVEDGAAHKLLLALTPVALRLHQQLAFSMRRGNNGSM